MLSLCAEKHTYWPIFGNSKRKYLPTYPPTLKILGRVTANKHFFKGWPYAVQTEISYHVNQVVNQFTLDWMYFIESVQVLSERQAVLGILTPVLFTKLRKKRRNQDSLSKIIASRFSLQLCSQSCGKREETEISLNKIAVLFPTSPQFKRKVCRSQLFYLLFIFWLAEDFYFFVL